MHEVRAPFKGCCSLLVCVDFNSFVRTQCLNFRTGQTRHMQIWGELYHRLAHMREYPGRTNTADRYALCDSLQYAAGADTEPSDSFPRHGYVRGGLYYGVLNCSTNLANVRAQHARFPY
jgi:hypothetical protein